MAGSEKKAPDEITETFSSDDIRFFSKPSKFTSDVDRIIGVKRYEMLSDKRTQANNFSMTNPGKQNPYTLSETEQNQIDAYEQKRSFDPESIHKQAEYWEKIYSKEPKNSFVNDGPYPDKKTLYTAFKTVYKNIHGVEFDLTEYRLENLASVINYFAREEKFFESPNLVKEIDGKPIENSFNKGLLIIGGYGCGKTSMLETMHKVIDFGYKESYNGLWASHKDWRRIIFNFAICNRMVTEFEGLNDPEQRVVFFQKYTNPKCYFDDLTKEKPASNFGIKNLMQDVFEKRSENKSITHATMNFPDYAPDNVPEALNLIGEKYGGHVYDRIKQMFNILHFKGGSMRK